MPRARADSPHLFAGPDGPDFSVETRLREAGATCVAGVDEAGRGPLAGPVVVGAVILDPGNIPPGLNDSKALTAAARLKLHDAILCTALSVAITSASAEMIDRQNILEATLSAMRRAVDALAVAPHHVLIDGNRLPPGLTCSATALVKGDARSLSIAAASIIAKVTRDRMMTMAHTAHADYGFGSHKGYGAAGHMLSIQRLGGVPRLHRFSFAPLKDH
jgi:ribonuclease HII